MRFILSLGLVPLLTWIAVLAQPPNLTRSIDEPNTPPTLAISAPSCFGSRSVHDLHLARISYEDCIPILNEILLDPDVKRRKEYTGGTHSLSRALRTCAITLATAIPDGKDMFWGYQIAIAAAVTVKDCVEDSLDRYGGLAWTTSRKIFYAQVMDSNHENVNLHEDILPNAKSSEPVTSASFPDPFVPFITNSTSNLLSPFPNRTASPPACQSVQYVFSDSMVPLLNQILSLETFKAHRTPLKHARLTPNPIIQTPPPDPPLPRYPRLLPPLLRHPQQPENRASHHPARCFPSRLRRIRHLRRPDRRTQPAVGRHVQIRGDPAGRRRCRAGVPGAAGVAPGRVGGGGSEEAVLCEGL